MFYAKMIEDASHTPTVGAHDGKPQNFDVIAFDTQAERQAAIDAKRNAGGNGFKCSRADAVSYFGRNFEMLPDGTIGIEGASDHYTHDELAAMAR